MKFQNVIKEPIMTHVKDKRYTWCVDNTLADNQETADKLLFKFVTKNQIQIKVTTDSLINTHKRNLLYLVHCFYNVLTLIC